MTTHPRPSFLVPLALVVALGSALAGCSAGGTASADSSGPSPAAASGSASSTSVTTGDGLCALVSVDAANAAVKAATPFTEQEPGSFVHDEPECGYSAGTDLSFVVNVTVWDLTTTPMDLSDGAWVGDDAYSTTLDVPGGHAAVGGFELDAVLGSKGLSLESLGSTALTQDQLVALAKLFAPHIH